MTVDIQNMPQCLPSGQKKVSNERGFGFSNAHRRVQFCFFRVALSGHGDLLTILFVSFISENINLQRLVFIQ